MKRITKLFQTVAQSIDDEAKTIRFKISDNLPDRMGEIVDQATWDFKNYLNNPVVFWGHESREPEYVLGTAQSLDIEGDATYATLKLDEDINPKAALVWQQLLRGTIRCVSVGFIAHSEEYVNDIPVLKDNELLEISIVPIPANPRAIALSLKEGTLSRKDAKWLMDTMRKESDLIEAQMKAEEQHKEKNMTDEQAKALIDAVANVTKTVEELKTSTEERFTALDEQIKAVAEAPVVDDDVVEGAEEDDPAKGGENDQPGAGEDIDLDAELTDEELEAQLATEVAEEADSDQVAA